MLIRRLTTPVLVGLMVAWGCGTGEPGNGEGAVTVALTGLPDSTQALWLLETAEGYTYRGGYLRDGEVDTVGVEAGTEYRLHLFPVRSTIVGIARTWSPAESLMAVAPVGAGEHRALAGEYALSTGAVALTASLAATGYYYATLSPVPPLPGAMIATYRTALGDTETVGDLRPGRYAVDWDRVDVQSDETSGEFQNHHAHVYRAEPDTVTVTAALAPVAVQGEYTLRSGEFRIGFSGLPPGLEVPWGFDRTDHGVAMGGYQITTPGLELIISTEYLGTYRYVADTVTAGGQTYVPAPSPTYQIVASTTPVDVVIAYTPLP